MSTRNDGPDRRIARLEADAHLYAARLEVVETLTRQVADTVGDLAEAVKDLVKAASTLAEHLGQARQEWMR